MVEGLDEPGESLEIVDDADRLADAVEWAGRELVEGRSFEDVSAELSAGGWSAAEVVDIVETARKRTRDERGVLHRDAVAGDVEARYRRSMYLARWSVFGLPAVLMAVRNTVASLLGMRRLHRRVDQQKQTSARHRGVESLESRQHF